MNESNRNTRTLIVSFVLAIMVLIPLRFVEVGQMVGDQVQVLGDQSISESVVLPDAEVTPKEVLEAPYNEIENSKVECIAKSVSDEILAADKSQIENGNLDAVEVDRLVNEMIDVEANTCK